MERFAIKIDKTLRANLYKICRLCGIDNPDKIKVRDDANIVNLEDGEPELWKKVFDCIGLMITKDDKMPQFMCTLCVDKINDFFEFREMCYATDGQTRKLLGIKGEPKAKAQAAVPSSSIDYKTEDIKEPFPEMSPLRAGRKRRNADLDISKEIKTDETEDIKPLITSVASNVSKKKRIKLSNITETETKIEPGSIKPGPAPKSTPVNTKKEPSSKLTAVNTKKEPANKLTLKVEPLAKIALSKKRLKTEPPVVVKENKKDIKSAKITKLMKKKLKLEAAPVLVPEQEEQQITRRKKELIKLKKLPQVIIKAERLRKSIIDTKIKEETSVEPPVPVSTPAPAPSITKTKPKPKEKCTICNEGFVNKAHLDKHVKATHIPTIQRYHCVQCNETLKKNMEIKNHNLWHKLSKTPFKCGKCSETSCSIYTYSKHIRDCDPIAYLDSHIPDWHCPDCSGNYETTFLFNIHSCVSKGLVCPGCEKSLKWKEDYFKHIPTCPSAFHRIPPYMTSNIQVKNEAELPTSPVPPLTTMVALPATTIVTVQSTPSTRITPPQMDSTQCVVIPGNLSLHEEAGSSSPSKTSRKGKRITKKDLKRFDKLLKSTMTTLVSIKHEPPQGVDVEEAVVDREQPSSSEVIEPRGPPLPPQPDSPPGSPMACGGDDDFHHNGDDSDSADEQTATKPVGTIKQEIIDEGYRDLYNNIEVNIKHEIEANKSVEEESSQKKTTNEAVPVSEDSSLPPKPILKLKITKEHGTLNSVLMDSPKSEKKKKKKKRKEDRVKSPDKEHSVADNDAMALPPVAKDVVPLDKEISFEKNVPTTKEDTSLACNKTVVSENEKEKEPAMPLPGIIQIKKEITEPAVDETDEEASSQNTTSIVASSSSVLQISCVSEGVVFHGINQNEAEMPQDTQDNVTNKNEEEMSQEIAYGCDNDQTNLTSDESANWAAPIPSMEISLSAVSTKDKLSLSCVDPEPTSTMQFAMTQETEEEIDIKPRLEDLIPIPMLQITNVTSGAEVIGKPVKTPMKRKRRPTVAKPNPMPKIVSVSSGTEVASYHPRLDVSSVHSTKSVENIPTDTNEDAFDFSQIKIKEEIVDPGYYEERSATPQQDEDVGEEEDEEAEEEAAEEEEAEEVEEEEIEEEADDVEVDDEQIKTLLLKKQADENAYIANIDFNNLTIKQEKEYIDDGLENPGSLEEDVDEEEEDAYSDNESEDVSSDDDDEDDDPNKSDSESEREYRDLPSEDDEKDKNDEKTETAPKITEIPAVMQNKTTPSKKPLDLQILAVHSEFSCPESGKKTESEELISDDKLSLNATTEREANKETIKLTDDFTKQEADKEAIEVTGINEQNKTLSCSEEQAIPMETEKDKEASELTDIKQGEVEKETIKLTNTYVQVNTTPSCSKEQAISMETDKGKETIQLSGISEDKGDRKTIDINKQLKKATSCSKDKETPMEIDTECEMHEEAFNIEHPEEVVSENEQMLGNTNIIEESVKIFDGISPQQTHSENIDHKESSKKHDFVMSGIKRADNLDQQEKEIVNQIKDLELQKPVENLIKSDFPQVCDDLKIKPNKQMERYPQEAVLESNILDRALYSGVSGSHSTSRLLHAFGNLETESVAETAPVRIKSQQTGADMISIDQCYDTAMQPIHKASTLVDGLHEETFGDNVRSQRNTELTNVMRGGLTSDVEMLPTFTNLVGIGLSNEGAFSTPAGQNDISGGGNQMSNLTELEPVGSTTEVPSTRLVGTHQICQTLVNQQLCDLPPTVHNAQHNSSLISTPVQSDSQLRETLKSALSFSMDGQIRYNEGNNLSQHTLHTNSSLTPTNHTPNTFENNNILMELGNAMGNSISSVNPSSYHDRQEFIPHSQVSSAAVYNIPPSPMELHQFNMPGSSYATFNCNNDPSRFTEYQDLTPPTAGQSQTSFVHQPSVNQSSELSANSLTNLSVLSEEVQNLLNEDTVAINNFEYNENVLRARASAAPIIPVPPVFNDFENLNEIAENNNNANIERELQDELGNVLADAIADRSNDDDVDDDNVMNENRANFDIT